MQITLTKEQVREAFGELRYMGADYCYKYDKETRKKTEEWSYRHLSILHTLFLHCQDTWVCICIG